MAISLTLASMASRVVRTASTQGENIRRIATSGSAQQDDGAGGFFDIVSGAFKFGASLLSAVWKGLGFIGFSFSALFGQIQRGTLFIWNFNWNISDTQINEQIKSAEIALAASKGSLVGTSLGFIVCGLIPAATIAVFNEALALYIIKEVGEEAVDEIASNLSTLINLQFQQMVRQTFFSLFKNFRTLFRGAASIFADGMVTLGQFNRADVEKAKKNRNEPFSFSGLKDAQIDAISNPIDKAYWEGVWDEFQDACIEAGFIVANSADSFFALQKMSTQAALGTEHLVEIQPVRNPDELFTP